MNKDEQIKKLQAQLENATKEIETVSKELEELKEPVPYKRWMPKNGQPYYAASASGAQTSFAWHGVRFDIGFYERGNCHKTEEEAIAFDKRQVELTKKLDKIKEINGCDSSWVDWKDSRQWKFFLLYDHEACSFSWTWVNSTQYLQDDHYLKTPEGAEEYAKWLTEQGFKTPY